MASADRAHLPTSQNTGFFQVISLRDTDEQSPQTREYKRRRPHKKTKAGCLACKQRRVKCDQAQPRCLRCRRNHRECIYAHLAEGSSASAGDKQLDASLVENVQQRPESGQEVENEKQDGEPQRPGRTQTQRPQKETEILVEELYPRSSQPAGPFNLAAYEQQPRPTAGTSDPDTTSAEGRFRDPIRLPEPKPGQYSGNCQMIPRQWLYNHETVSSRRDRIDDEIWSDEGDSTSPVTRANFRALTIPPFADEYQFTYGASTSELLHHFLRDNAIIFGMPQFAANVFPLTSQYAHLRYILLAVSAAHLGELAEYKRPYRQAERQYRALALNAYQEALNTPMSEHGQAGVDALLTTATMVNKMAFVLPATYSAGGEYEDEEPILTGIKRMESSEHGHNTATATTATTATTAPTTTASAASAAAEGRAETVVAIRTVATTIRETRITESASSRSSSARTELSVASYGKAGNRTGIDDLKLERGGGGNVWNSWVFNPDASHMAWLTLLVGMRSLVLATEYWLKRGFLRPAFYTRNGVVRRMRRPCASLRRSPAHWIELLGLERDLTQDQASRWRPWEDGTNKGSKTAEDEMFRGPLYFITELWWTSLQDRNMLECFQFVSLINSDFRNNLLARDNLTLWIFGMWLGLMCMCDMWWVRRRVRCDFRAIRQWLHMAGVANRPGREGILWRQALADLDATWGYDFETDGVLV